MVRSPAGTRQSPSAARDAAGPARDHIPLPPKLIGHAGLALRSPGGAPTRRHLDEALRLRLDAVELDLCTSADGRLLLRHDTAVADGRFVADLDLAALRRLEPDLLTLDEALEQLGGHVPVLLDLKMAHAAQALGRWARGRRDLTGLAVCTENVPWLLHLRFAAPRLARWPSFPDLGDHSRHHIQRVLAGLWRSHASVGDLRRGVADVHSAARLLRSHPHDSLARLGGLPWRARLPLDFAQPCRDAGAEGICVQAWSISGRLVEEGQRAGLLVNAWTVNNPRTAQDLAALGVDSITTDRVAAIRLALGAGSPPRRPADSACEPLREAVRTSRP